MTTAQHETLAEVRSHLVRILPFVLLLVLLEGRTSRIATNRLGLRLGLVLLSSFFFLLVLVLVVLVLLVLVASSGSSSCSA